MKNRRCTSRHCLALMLASGTVLTAPARATILSWNNALGGSASTAANWNPVQSPTSADDLQFSLNAAYPVTFNASSAASRTQTYRIGTVTLNCSAPHTVSTGITVGSASPDIADVTLSTGTLNSTSSVTIGSGNLAQGTLRVSDDTADLILTGAAADLIIGSNGIGTLNVTGGGRVVVPDQLIAGNNSTAVAHLTVSGALAVSPFTRSTLDVTGVSQSRLGQGGDATVSIASGAIASFAGDVIVSNGSASTSTVTVGGTGGLAGLQRATLTVAGDLSLGKNTTAGSAAGTATLTVNGGGTVTSGGTLSVAGDPDGGTATLVMNNGAVINTHSLDLGTGGTISLTGGHITVDGGFYAHRTSAPVYGSSNDPVITLTNGCLGTVPGGQAVSIGSGSAGADLAHFEVLAGARYLPSNTVTLGAGTGDNGNVLVTGVGSQIVCSGLTIGSLGTGVLTVSDAGEVYSNSVGITIAASAGSTGTVIVEGGANFSAASADGIAVGGTAVAQGGTGSLTVQTGGIANASGDLVIWPGSSLVVNSGGRADAVGSMNIRGSLTMNAGAINSPNFNLLGSATLTAVSGVSTIDGNFHGNPAATITATGGDLILGDPAALAGFEHNGLLSVGSRSVTLRDALLAVVSNTTMAGGTLATTTGLHLNSGSTLSGFGTIVGDFRFAGSVTPSGTGLRFSGLVTPLGGTITGTAVGFNAGAGYTGATSIAADVDADAGSTITATGNLSLGRSTSAFGCTIDGTLLCQNHTVTLLDSNGVGLGILTDLGTANGVRLICAQSIQVASGRVLQGEGSIQTPLLSIFGTIKPGDEVFFNSVPGTGIIGVTGAVTLGPAASYFCELGDPLEGFNQDRISATGVATVNGALHVSLEPGFTPFVGEIFDVVIGSSRTGTFSTEDVPPGFGVLYMSDRVRLVFNGLPCEGDLNCDGNVDQDDVAALIATIAGNPTDFCRDDPDINHDGNADQDDVTAFINLIAGGPCP